MESLNFLSSFSLHKERTWSGTTYSLYKALEKYYTLNDINISSPFLVQLALKLLRVHWFNSGFYQDSLSRKKCKNLQGKVFQFSEIKSNDEKTKTYIYQDLSVSYIKYMKKNLPEVFEKSGFKGIDEKILQKRLAVQNKYYSTCSAIFTMGKWLKNFLISQGIPREKIFAVGGGTNVKINLIHPQPKRQNKILFVGRDFERKGGFITYNAFKILKNKISDAELYVAGPKENPISDSVKGYHFLGDLKYDELSEFYNKCDIFCMPSYFEAYGLVFIEALIFGLPCIGRNCYEMPSFIEEGKSGYLLSQNGSVEELAEKMELALKNKEMQNFVISKRDIYIEKYSWSSVAERIKDVIDRF